MKITIADATGRVDPHARRHEDRRDQPRDVEPRAGPPPDRPASAAAADRRPGRRAGNLSWHADGDGKTVSKPVQVLQDIWLRERSGSGIEGR